MFRKFLSKQHQQSWRYAATRRSSFSLQIVLWLLWSLMVAVVAYLSWHADVAADRPIDTLALVIHCVAAGLIGLVVLTWVEMRIEPWRFVDKDE